MTQKRKRNFFVVVSVAFHMAFLLLPSRKISFPAKPLQVIDFKDQVLKELTPHHANSKDSRGKRALISVEKLTPHWTNLGFESPSLPKSESTADDPATVWGAGASDFKRVEDLGLMNRIYDVTEENLFYPSVFANHKIEGIVNSRVVLNQDGKCDWHQTNISTTNAHLRVFVLSVLKNVCSHDFKRYLRGRKSTNVDFSFEFEITEHNDKQIVDAKKRIIGNVLMLYRNTQSSVAEWKLGPFRGMFPIPYVAMDFGWLQENWERIVNKRDPLKEYELGI